MNRRLRPPSLQAAKRRGNPGVRDVEPPPCIATAFVLSMNLGTALRHCEPRSGAAIQPALNDETPPWIATALVLAMTKNVHELIEGFKGGVQVRATGTGPSP